MQKIFLACAISLVSILATAADLNGHWIGYGDWIYQGQGTHCSSMTLSFSESDKILQRTDGSFECDFASTTLDSKSWTKADGSIREDSEVVGTFSPQHYEWTEIYSSTVTIKISIEVSANHLDYIELWQHKDGSNVYTIRGRLFSDR